MLARALRLLLARYAGPGRAAFYLALLAAGRRVLQRQPLVEAQALRPGERVVIEHLPISHKQQVKQLKREEQRARRERRAARKAARRRATRKAAQRRAS